MARLRGLRGGEAPGAPLDSAAVDPFALVLFVGLALVIGVFWLIGRFYPGSGVEQLGMRSARDILETREELEARDLDQMVAARNARRRARGEAEASSGDLELQVARELGEQARRRERYRAQQHAQNPDGGSAAAGHADAELDQLLAATNARRRARGLPERSREQAREQFGETDG